MDPLRARLAGLSTGRRRLVGAVIVLLAMVVLAGAVLISAMSSSGAEGTYSPSRAAPAVSRPAPSPSHLLVHVVGAVRRPGLVAVAAGARGVDALAAAGGPRADADLDALNLAARVADGQQLAVLRKGARATPTTGVATGSTAGGSGGAGGGGALVSLSSATATELEALPRIGPAMAARIIAWREAHGGFRSIADLRQVSGIGPKTLAGLQDLVTP